MKVLQILFSGLMATLAMTFFNAIFAKSKSFRTLEPQRILSKMVHRKLTINHSSSLLIGWALHLITGFLFSKMDKVLIKKSGKINAGPAKSLFYGAADGLLGILIWKLTFKLHPNPPKINLKGYFLQLLVAHLFYGLVHGQSIKYYNKSIE